MAWTINLPELGSSRMVSLALSQDKSNPG
uniref:Uncharacterized protein n=1 Tax=Rhizophora mucronata TaxID=61149 RepID=A0A2P2PJK9_RHIMU